MPKNWERTLFLLLVSVILAILAWLVLDLGRSAMGQEAQPTMVSTSWVAPAATFTPVLQPWTPQPMRITVYLPLIALGG